MAQWIQPVLTANGSIGDVLAVSSGGGATSDAYKAFDSSDSSYVNKMNSGAWLQFVTRATIKINAITISSNGSLPQAGIFQVSYDNGATWTQCGTWTDTLGTSTTANIVFDTSVTGNYFRFLSQGRSLAKPDNNADFCNVIINADYVSGNVTIDFDAERIIKHSVTIPTNRYSISFADSDYATLPLDVLPNASVFTIEAKFSTTSTKSSDNNWQWGTIAGLEIGGNWENDFGLCVNNGYLCFWAEPSTGGSSSTRNTVSNAIVNDGLIHNVAVVSNADSSIDLFCDGVKVAHTDNVNAKISDSYNIRVAYDNDPNSYLPMDLYELRFWSTARNDIWADISGSEDNLEAWLLPTDNALLDFSGFDRHATISGNPAFNLLSSGIHLDLSFDAQRIVKNPLTTWRYENAGTADLLTVSGTTLTDLPVTQSKTGSAFYQTARAKCFDTPATKEIWAKFDVYTTLAKRWRAYNNNTNGVCSYTDGTFTYWDNSTVVKEIAGKVKNQLQTVLLHMVSDSAEGVIEAWLDGEKLYTYIGNVNNGEDFADIFLQSDGEGTFFSNVIISNAKIELDENVGSSIHFDVDFDAERIVGNTVSIDFDAQRLVYRFAILDFDAQRIVKKTLTIDFDSCRNVHRTVNFLVDTCRNISHKFIMTPAKDGILYAYAEESTGIQSLQIDIAPQQITDQFSFATVNNVDILQNVKGQYLDYVFDLRIEKTTQKGILNTCLCCSDVDKILYTQLAYKVKSTSGGLFAADKDGKTTMQEKPKASAHTHIKKIADILGKNLVYLADEFTSTVDTDPEGVTYNDLIRDIFGWSSRVPTKLINVYIRNDSLYVVQRGHEQNTIDISDKLIANLTITKELYRTTWGSTPTSWTVTQKNTTYGDWEPILGNPLPDDYPSTGSDDEPLPPEPSDTSRVLPRRVVTDEFGVRTVVEYDYDDDGNVTKTTTTTEFLGTPEGMTVVENSYTTIGGRKMLASETTSEYDWDSGKSDWQFVDKRTVHHSYLTQGQQNVTAVDADGKIKGSLTSSSRTDDRPTPYENKQYTKTVDGNTFTSSSNPDWAWYTYVDGVKYEVLGFRKKKSSEEKEITNYGIALYDSSFPIDDIGTLSKLTAELRRLNRTTQETISLDIYDFPHVFDFNDKIIFGGNEYFLDSNSVSKNPRIVNKQSLKLVRWY